MQLITLGDLTGYLAKQVRQEFGGKASGLYEAFLLDIPLPETWLLGILHFEAFIKSSSHLSKEGAVDWLKTHLREALALLPSNQTYAVRSSSLFEDAFEKSFAGIFDSKLCVPKEGIAEAIADVWYSCFSFRVSSYAEALGDLKMGVLIQPMVEAKFSGVAFSKHPSPSHVYENQNIVIEFGPHSGEKIVQGEVTPFRLSGTADTLFSSTDTPWITPLLQTILKLKNAYKHEIDIEFVIDPRENFWLVQQRPISTLHHSRTLDLSFYVRKYKRSLYSLDIEFLIEGCALFLPGYLEIPVQMEKWMVMTTSPEGIQELWVQDLLDHIVVQKIGQRIAEDPTYLSRLHQRYEKNHNHLLHYEYSLFARRDLPLETRFFSFCEYILPLEAHYYVPMFMIEALHALLLAEFKKIDPVHAEPELFFMGTWGIESLVELFYDELRSSKQYAALTAQYAFLKCRSLEEVGYTEQEIRALEIPEKVTPDERPYLELRKKYLDERKHELLFGWFREWMRIRNQEMEYLQYALYQARPLFEEIGALFSLPLKKIWNTSKERIRHALSHKDPVPLEQFSTEKLAIFRSFGKTRLNNQLTIIRSSEMRQKSLRGKTVYGSGGLTAPVKIAFSVQELADFHSEVKPILVTGMTTPDFIPYLKKGFSALVTDEGGILCHAAIVAREIPIPCIVGTGIATEVLKEGQSITLDFDKGEVLSIVKNPVDIENPPLLKDD